MHPDMEHMVRHAAPSGRRTRPVAAPRCISWLHADADATPPMAGGRFCAKHIGEKQEADRVARDLADLSREVRAFASEHGRHPDEAKDFLEVALRAFLDKDLVPLGLHCVSGYRRVPGKKTKEQLDVVLVLKVGRRGDWNATLTAHKRVDRARVGMHIEIAFRAKGVGGLARKVREDLQSLQRSTDQGVASRRALPWTGLVLLGAGWGDGSVAMREVHRAYHDREPARVRLGGSYWWPYLDAVALPKALFKKHDLFESAQLRGTTWPCHAEMPALGRNQLQPIAVARAFLVHRVCELLHDGPLREEQAWPTEMSSAILGPPPRRPRRLPRIWLPFDAPDSLTALWHHGSNPVTGRSHPIELRLCALPRCPRKRPMTVGLRRRRRGVG